MLSMKIVKKGQFLSEKMKENRFIKIEKALKQNQTSSRGTCDLVFSDEILLSEIRRLTEEIIDGYLKTLLKFQELCTTNSLL